MEYKSSMEKYKMDTIKLKSDKYVLILDTEEMRNLNRIMQIFRDSINQDVLRNSGIAWAESIIEGIPELVEISEKFRSEMWAWNKLHKGRLLDKETHGWSRGSKQALLELIGKIQESRIDW